MPNQKANAALSLICSIKDALEGGLTTCCYSGNGSPEGVQTADVGSVYIQIDDPGVIWSKVTGTGNTGWATAGAATYLYGNGSPEGSVIAAVGRYYVQQDAPGVIWVKVSGAGDTGWAVNS